MNSSPHGWGLFIPAGQRARLSGHAAVARRAKTIGGGLAAGLSYFKLRAQRSTAHRDDLGRARDFLRTNNGKSGQSCRRLVPVSVRLGQVPGQIC
jgi:hypothetical protein